MFQIKTFKDKDIFSFVQTKEQREKNLIVNPINRRGIQGGGLALQFRRRYPLQNHTYVEICKKCVNVGITLRAYINRPSENSEEPYILQFVSKPDPWIQSTLGDIKSALDRTTLILSDPATKKFENVIFTEVGCGLGGLDWTNVKPLIVEASKDWTQVDNLIFLESTKAVKPYTNMKFQVGQSTK